MYLSARGGNVDDFKLAVNEAFGSSDYEFVWADYDYEVRRIVEDGRRLMPYSDVTCAVASFSCIRAPPEWNPVEHRKGNHMHQLNTET